MHISYRTIACFMIFFTLGCRTSSANSKLAASEERLPLNEREFFRCATDSHLWDDSKFGVFSAQNDRKAFYGFVSNDDYSSQHGNLHDFFILPDGVYKARYRIRQWHELAENGHLDIRNIYLRIFFYKRSNDDQYADFLLVHQNQDEKIEGFHHELVSLDEVSDVVLEKATRHPRQQITAYKQPHTSEALRSILLKINLGAQLIPLKLERLARGIDESNKNVTEQKVEKAWQQYFDWLELCRPLFSKKTLEHIKLLEEGQSTD